MQSDRLDMEGRDVEEGEKLLHQNLRESAPAGQHHGRTKISLVILAALCIALVSFSAGLLFGLQQSTRSQIDHEMNGKTVPQGNLVALDDNNNTDKMCSTN